MEKRFVFYDRAADSSAELIADQEIPRAPVLIVEPGIGIERRVAVGLKQAAVKGIGSRPRRDLHLAGAMPQFGVGRGGGDANLTDGIGTLINDRVHAQVL